MHGCAALTSSICSTPSCACCSCACVRCSCRICAVILLRDKLWSRVQRLGLGAQLLLVRRPWDQPHGERVINSADMMCAWTGRARLRTPLAHVAPAATAHTWVKKQNVDTYLDSASAVQAAHAHIVSCDGSLGQGRWRDRALGGGRARGRSLPAPVSALWALIQVSGTGGSSRTPTEGPQHSTGLAA